MKTVKMKKEEFEKFIEFISSKGKLYGPKEDRGHIAYREIKSVNELRLEQTRVMIGLKQFVTPPVYSTKIFNDKGAEDVFPENEQIIVIGAHPCDIHGLKTLDKLFLGQIKDPYYEERRKNLFIIGHSCLPDENCLCLSTGTDMVQDGFDLFLTDLSEFYLVWVGSSKGLYMLIEAEELFDENITKEDVAKYIEWQQRRHEMFVNQIPLKQMADIIELTYDDNELWEELSTKCLNCGTCSIVCPTCNCFNVSDEIILSSDSIVRKRMQDSCTLPNFSVVAGGHNFRPSSSDRLKLYYTHKLKEYIGRWGEPGCVGCGRCVSYCPVDINVRSVATRLYEKVVNVKEVVN